MEVSDARRLKALEDENTKLKKLLAEAMLDNAMLRDVAAPARSRNANESATEQSNRSKSTQHQSRTSQHPRFSRLHLCSDGRSRARRYGARRGPEIEH